MPKPSEQQHQVADIYSELAASVLRERGFHLGESLNAAQAKSMASDLKGLEKRWRERARRNESIGS